MPNPEAVRFRFGYVDQPKPGHEKYRGMLSIPYLRRGLDNSWSVVSLRYRCIREDCEHSRHGGKYLTMPGDTPRLFNTLALIDNHDTVAITEGELDAVSATLAGVPAVGVGGVESWKPHFREPFLGYETVYILADNDVPKYRDDCPKCKDRCRGHNPGADFADRLAKTLPNAKVCLMPVGEDVNSFVMTNGPQALRERIGWK